MANSAGKISDVSQRSSLQVSVPELVCPGPLLGRKNQLSSYVGDTWSGVGLLEWPFGFEGIMQEGCEQGGCVGFCVISGVGAASSIGLSAAPQGPRLCLEGTAEGKFGIMGVLAQAGGLGSLCAALSSCQRHWESLCGAGEWKAGCKGCSCSTPSPSAAGPRERGQNGESKVLVTLWGWAAQAEQEVIFSFGRCLVLLLVLWPPLTPLLSVPTELLY